MTALSRSDLVAQMMICNLTLKNLLQQIKDLENNDQLSANSKLIEIKKIQEEIKKVGTEIDTVKKAIILLNAYNVN